MHLSSVQNKSMESDSNTAVTLVYSPASRQVVQQTLSLSEPCSILQALRLSNLLVQFPEIDHPEILLGVWGRRATLHHVLRDGDRVEVYRPLRVDPKVARRQRFAQQGTRLAGLFTKKRAGAKSGY
jgi:putative ubiquitin-RnfH superfamily antitoxin RatB of RatAB toxin-antitoxin module